MFAISTAKTDTTTIAMRPAIIDDTLCPFTINTPSPSSFKWKWEAKRFNRSCPATDETEHRMLSTVEISPARIRRKNKYRNHFGVKLITENTFTNCVSDTSNPAPAAKKPKRDSDTGTIPNITAARSIVFFTSFSFTQKARCQNI